MISLLKDKSAELAELCRAHNVARLEVFGSAAGDSFDPRRSDIAFLGEFQRDIDLEPWLARYFDLRDDLSRLLGRPVDLVMISAS
jgi:predicted nucleotidyltransferase